MNTETLLACGVLFRSTADPEAGCKLLEGLESRDPALRIMAKTFLVEGGSASLSILEEAFRRASWALTQPLHASPKFCAHTVQRKGAPLNSTEMQESDSADHASPIESNERVRNTLQPI